MNNIIISDNFFPDLSIIKNDVMNEQEFHYVDNQSYPGQRTECLSVINPEYYAWFCERLFELMFDMRCIDTIDAEVATHFQKIESFSEDKDSILNHGAIHQDEAIISGIIYFNSHSGTNLYRLKEESNLEKLKQEIDIFEPIKRNFYCNKPVDLNDYAEKLSYINSNFDIDLQVTNKVNRIFLFPSECYHGVPSFYGSEPRYTQVFFIRDIKLTTYPETKKAAYVGKHKIRLTSPPV